MESDDNADLIFAWLIPAIVRNFSSFQAAKAFLITWYYKPGEDDQSPILEKLSSEHGSFEFYTGVPSRILERDLVKAINSKANTPEQPSTEL
jgi:hypothetical protein